MFYAITIAEDGLITAVHESMGKITEALFRGTDFDGQTVISVPPDKVQAGLYVAEYTAAWELRPLSERVAGGYAIVPDGFVLDGDEFVPIPQETEPEPHPAQNPWAEIDILKAQLAESDYKIIKAYEYSLMGIEIPYDMQAIHVERQELRDKINQKEEELQHGADS